MNELQLKGVLQAFFVAIPTTQWDGLGTPRCFVNIYQGNSTGSDTVVSKQSKKELQIELSIESFGLILNTLDSELLSYKIQIETLIRNNKSTPIISGLKFQQWIKEIDTDGIAETEIRYRGKIKLFYKLSIFL